MILSNSQKYCLDIVQKFGAVRRKNLVSLLNNEFTKLKGEMTIDTLVRFKRLLCNEEIICVYRACIDMDMVEAVSVMLEICDIPENIVAGNNANLLRFHSVHDQHIRQYRICKAMYAYDIQDDCTVIILGTDADKDIKLNKNYYLAIKEASNYRFYTKQED